MPRPKSGPHLWLDENRQTWTVIDGRKSVRTGCGKSDIQAAKDFLRDYLAANHAIEADSDPAIVDMLTVYADEQIAGGPSAANIATDLTRLEEWWGDKKSSDITRANCDLYIAHRGHTPSCCRRELGFLHAAAMYWHKGKDRGPLRRLPIIKKPPPSPHRIRWLTRSEAARFLWATRKLKPGQRKRIRRFFIIGWYTGTRHAAIAGTRYDFVDLETGIMLRRAPGVAETRKRTPPVRAGRRLLSHLRRWRRLDGPEARYIIAFGGKPCRKLSTGFYRARDLAKLSKDVMPHTLRHSRATHLMRQGVDPWQAAQSLGMDLATLWKIYGHHHPDWQSEAAEAK